MSPAEIGRAVIVAAIDLGNEQIMTVTIFDTDSGSTKTWLQVNDDGTVTYHEENSGWRMSSRGTQPRDRIMTAEEAKSDWTAYANDIDEASAAVASKKGHPSN
jgi:hypothetical protein